MTENEIIKDKKKTSKEWLDVFSIDRKWIYDPDGWDRSNFVFSFEEEKITAAKFEERLTMSTILFGEDAIKFPLVARSDYEPKPEVVKCEIKPKGNEHGQSN